MNTGQNKRTFRSSASFGKRMEYAIIAQMLKEGMDVYVPLVDDNGIDAVVRKPDGTFVEVQIKARSANVNPSDGSLFAAIRHEHRPNYWFVFYAEGVRPDVNAPSAQPMTWVLSSQEFIDESTQNKTGKNVGLRSIWFNGYKTNKHSKEKVSYAKPQFDKYVVTKLSDRIIDEIAT